MKKLKKIIKALLPPKISIMVKEILGAVNSKFESIDRNFNSLMMARKIEEKGLSQMEILKNSEFKIHSQNGEDGIIQYIFSKIGTTNKACVEFGIEDGRECNTANLLINNGWNGLLMDGNKKSVAEARYYYNAKQGVLPNQVRIVGCFVTRDNINQILKMNKMNGEIDLLSLDIDGNDYWVWEAIEAIQPRLVVIEYNASLGEKMSLSVEYDPSFERFSKHKSGYYHGASLAALTKLANKKGYSLIGCDCMGCNAFFLKKELLKKGLAELSVKEAYYPQLRRIRIETNEQQFEKIKHLKFEKI